MNCFKMCIFAVASTINLLYILESPLLWIASKCVSLQWQAQLRSVLSVFAAVVNCFKMCIFAVASTIHLPLYINWYVLWIASKCVSLQWQAQYIVFINRIDRGCELLQNVYLCSGKHNRERERWKKGTVVNCFKMCIFAVASTIEQKNTTSFV